MTVGCLFVLCVAGLGSLLWPWVPLTALPLPGGRGVSDHRGWLRRSFALALSAVLAALVGLGLRMTTHRTGPPTSTASLSRHPSPPATSTRAGCAETEAGTSTCAVAGDVADVDDAVRVPLGRPLLLEFVSEHCAVCARLAPLVSELERYCTGGDGSIVRVSLESTQGRALARHFEVRALPTFLQLDIEGREVDRSVGEQTWEQLASAIGSVRGEACGEKPPL